MVIELLTPALETLAASEFWALLLIIVVLPRCILLLLKGREASDQWQHMLYANEFRGAALTDLGRELPRFFPKAIFNYPPAVQFLIEKFGVQFVSRYVASINVGLLCLEAVVIIYLWSDIDLATRPALLVSAVCWGMFPFYVLPISGVLSVSGRLPGALLGNLYFLMVCSALSIETKCFLALPLILLAVFISKFAVQSIIIISLIASVYSQSLDFLAVMAPAGAIALYWAPSRAILRGSYSHTTFYAKIMQYIHVATVVRNKSVVSAFFRGLGGTPKELLKTIYHVPVIRLFCCFSVLFFVFFFLRSNSSVEQISQYNSAEAVLASSIISALLFSAKHLKFLGEADRYATFTSVLIAFSCLPLLVVEAPTLGLALLLITAATWVALVTALKRKLRSQYPKDQTAPILDEVLAASVERVARDLAVKVGREPYLMAIPQNLCEKTAVMFTDYRIIGLSGNQAVSAETEEYAAVLYSSSCYPYPVNVQEYANLIKYPIVLVIEKQYLAPDYLKRSGLFASVSAYYDGLDAIDVDSEYSLVTFTPCNDGDTSCVCSSIPPD